MADAAQPSSAVPSASSSDRDGNGGSENSSGSSSSAAERGDGNNRPTASVAEQLWPVVARYRTTEAVQRELLTGLLKALEHIPPPADASSKATLETARQQVRDELAQFPASLDSRGDKVVVEADEKYRRLLVRMLPNPAVTFETLAGMSNEKRLVIESLVVALRYPALKKKTKALLLYGPPGTGKTEFVKAAAHRLRNEYAFYSATGDALKGKYIGETEKQIKAAFDWAVQFSLPTDETRSEHRRVEKELQERVRGYGQWGLDERLRLWIEWASDSMPKVWREDRRDSRKTEMTWDEYRQWRSQDFQFMDGEEELVQALDQPPPFPKIAADLDGTVLFIDEVDALVPSRSRADGGASVGTTAQVTQMFQMLEGAQSDRYERVKLVCATNLPWNLDEGFLRRMTRKIFIDLPDDLTRAQLVSNRLQQYLVYDVEDNREAYAADREKRARPAPHVRAYPPVEYTPDGKLRWTNRWTGGPRWDDYVYYPGGQEAAKKAGAVSLADVAVVACRTGRGPKFQHADKQQEGQRRPNGALSSTEFPAEVALAESCGYSLSDVSKMCDAAFNLAGDDLLHHGVMLLDTHTNEVVRCATRPQDVSCTVAVPFPADDGGSDAPRCYPPLDGAFVSRTPACVLTDAERLDMRKYLTTGLVTLRHFHAACQEYKSTVDAKNYKLTLRYRYALNESGDPNDVVLP